MNQRRFETNDGNRRTGRRSLLKAGGFLAGAASLLPVSSAVKANDMTGARTSLQGQTMPTWKPDPTFYPTPRAAMQAPAETLGYVVQVNPKDDGQPDMIRVIDLDPESSTYGEFLSGVTMPTAGDELHHFGWNACSSMLCPNAAHPHVERRYLIAPGLRSSNVHIIDTKPDPANPVLVKTIDAADIAARTGYAKGHTVHCGPNGIYVSALGSPDGGGPGGIFMLDHDTFEPLGAWEIERGDQQLHYDFWWHLGYDTMVSSE